MTKNTLKRMLEVSIFNRVSVEYDEDYMKMVEEAKKKAKEMREKKEEEEEKN